MFTWAGLEPVFVKKCFTGVLPSLKQTFSHLKINGWKASLSFLEGLFSGVNMLVLGSVVSYNKNTMNTFCPWTKPARYCLPQKYWDLPMFIYLEENCEENSWDDECPTIMVWLSKTEVLPKTNDWNLKKQPFEEENHLNQTFMILGSPFSHNHGSGKLP